MIAKAKLPFLDSLRGLAILAVFLFHCASEVYGGDWIQWDGLLRDFKGIELPFILLPLTIGWAGVAVFFVISGFCIHLSWRKNSNGGIRAFYLRRFFRVYPPYFLALCLFTVMLMWESGFVVSTWVQFLTHTGLVHNFAGRWFFGINPSFWSIAVEWQLYLLYPLLLLLIRKFGWIKTLWLVGLIEVGMRFFACYHGVIRNHELPVSLSSGIPFYYWFSWTLGAMLAEIYLSEGKLPFLKFPTWVFPGLFIAASFFRPVHHFGFLFAALCTVQVLSKMLNGKATVGEPEDVRQNYSASWLNRNLTSIGVISYSIYLLHQPLLSLIAGAVTNWKFVDSLATRQAIGMVACLLAWWPIYYASKLSYRFIELKSVELGRKWMSISLVSK